MKKRFNTFIVLVMLLFLSQHVFSEEIKQNSSKYLLEKITDQSTEYPAIFLDEENSILFTKEKFSSPDIETPFDYQIAISLFKKNINKKIPIDLLPYWGGPGKIEEAFIHHIQNQTVLFVLFKIDSPKSTGVPYSSDHYFVLPYEKTPEVDLVLNKKLFNYFGNGADVTDILLTDEAINKNITINLPINAYSYPYKTKKEVIAALSTNLFNDWMNNKVITATILRKTKLQEVPNYYDETKKYLIAGNTVMVKNITAGWLYIEYQNAKKGTITGWIMCKDTDACS